jgi:hypothetical protein
MRDLTTDLKPKPKPPSRRWRRMFILSGCATFVLAIVGVGYAVATAFNAMFAALTGSRDRNRRGSRGAVSRAGCSSGYRARRVREPLGRIGPRDNHCVGTGAVPDGDHEVAGVVVICFAQSRAFACESIGPSFSPWLIC